MEICMSKLREEHFDDIKKIIRPEIRRRDRQSIMAERKGKKIKKIDKPWSMENYTKMKIERPKFKEGRTVQWQKQGGRGGDKRKRQTVFDRTLHKNKD